MGKFQELDGAAMKISMNWDLVPKIIISITKNNEDDRRIKVGFTYLHGRSSHAAHNDMHEWRSQLIFLARYRVTINT